MWRVMLILLTALTFAAVGLYLGLSIHGPGVRAVLACISGAAGGFGAGVIGFDVWRQNQAMKQRLED